MLDDRCFNVLVFGQPAPTSSIVGGGERLRMLAIPDGGSNRTALAGVGIGGQAFYLVRPDGHIGLAGTRFDEAAVARYFADHHVRVGGRTHGEPREAAPAL